MLQLGNFRISGKKEIALYIFSGISALYYIVNGLLPKLVGREKFISLSPFVEIPLYLIGVIALTIVSTIFVLIMVSIFTESRKKPKQNDIVITDILSMIKKNPELVAPNLSSVARGSVIDTIKQQIKNGEVKFAHAILDPGEESTQILILETNMPKKIVEDWQEQSNGVCILKSKKAKKYYGIVTDLFAVEVVFD